MAYQLIQASAAAIPLADETVQTCVTSPPYWGLREYAGEQGVTWADGDVHPLGLEPTPELYVEHMVEVFREVRRVLRPDGTLWLNLGSSYMGSGQGGGGSFSSERPGWAGIVGRSERVARAGTRRESAYGSDGTEPGSSLAPDAACHGLCDGCLADYQNHLHRTPDSDQHLGQSRQPDETTARGSGHPGFAGASPGASPLDAQASTSLESWLLQRGPCSRCDSRVSALAGAHSSSGGVRASVRNSWLNYTRSLKAKDMVPIPWLVAMALQHDGWYLRSDIIWSKPNPMPESVTDRPTKSHEYIFLLSKSARYYFDADAVREAAEYGRRSNFRGGGAYVMQEQIASNGVKPTESSTTSGSDPDAGRNIRTVWDIATQPFPGAHFATFPEAIPERCIKAGSAPGDLVLDPFNGSGTTGRVAQRLSRDYVGLDTSRKYLEMAVERVDPILAATHAARDGEGQGVLAL